MATSTFTKTNISIPCPLCGQEMEWEYVAFFCRSGERRHTGNYSPCMGVSRDVGSAIEHFNELPRGHGGERDGYQFYAEANAGVPATHAVVLDNDGNVLITAQFVRGENGCTNFNAMSSLTAEEQAEAVSRYGWQLAPWWEC